MRKHACYYEWELPMHLMKSAKKMGVITIGH